MVGAGVGESVGAVGAGVAGSSMLRDTVVHTLAQYTSQSVDPMGGEASVTAFSALIAQSDPRLLEEVMSGGSLSKTHMAA
jgi:hypothetical protein